MNTDVLIIGAGPTGLALACQLIRYGVVLTRPDNYIGLISNEISMGTVRRYLSGVL